VFVALDVIVIGTVSAIVHVHVHGNDTVGVIGSVDDRAASMEATTVNVSLAAG
jgi:hypothetical protein